jgi:hypothetical protein
MVKYCVMSWCPFSVQDRHLEKVVYIDRRVQKGVMYSEIFEYILASVLGAGEIPIERSLIMA